MLRQAHGSPKLAHLKARLDIPRFQAVGILETLWHFTATQAPRGDIGKWTDGEIASALEWQGKPDELIEALVAARWVDRCPKYRLLVHDWPLHCDQTVKRSPQVKMRGFAEAVASESLVSDASVASDSLHSLTPEPEPEPEPEPSAPSGALVPRSRPKRPARTPAPEALSEDQRTRLRTWCAEKHPRFVSRLVSLEDACLGHHRGCGNLKADWCETVMTWIRNEAEGRFSGSRGPAPEPPRPRPPLVTPPSSTERTAAEVEMAKRREEHRQKLIGEKKPGPLAGALLELVPRPAG